VLEDDQVPIARQWLTMVDEEVKRLAAGGAPKALKDILVLKEDKTIEWREDEKWDLYMKCRTALPGE
jgi:hypothetical protein